MQSSYDGDDDEIDLSFYGPKGMEYTIEVLVDGSVEYTHDDSKSTLTEEVTQYPLDDFWAGNAMRHERYGLVDYEIRVTSDGGEDSMIVR